MSDSLNTITVDLRAIDHNIKAIKRLLAPTTTFMAVVKSNAYGHGLFEVSKQAIKSGADYLGVISAEEAISLRKWGFIKPIVVLGAVEKEDIKALIKHKVGITIFNEETYRTVLRMATLTNHKAIVHIKIDTGLNRLGLTNGDALKVIQKIHSKPRIFNLEGIYSHFASIEEMHQSYTKDQIRNFERLLKKISDLKITIPLISMCGTAAAIMHPEAHFNCVRIGIGIYGLWPSRGVEVWAKRNKKTRTLKLKPALSYKTKLIHVHRVPAGSYIGYGSTFQARSAMTIGVIPVGYAEGLSRSLSNMGFALLKGGVLPIIGRVAMNMTILDLSKRPRAKVGDDVILIGTSQTKHISATDIGDWGGTISYEVVTRIPEHIERLYKM